MKQLFLILCLIIIPSIILAAKRERERESESLTSGLTNYNTGDGNERHEELDADGTVKGHYSYIDPTGKKVHVNYSAGKQGFKATGNHFATFNLGDSSPHDSHDQDDEGSYQEEHYDFADNIQEEDEEEADEEEIHHHTHHQPPPPPPPTQKPIQHHFKPQFPKRPNFKPSNFKAPEPVEHPTKFGVQHPKNTEELYTTIEEYHTVDTNPPFPSIPKEYQSSHGPISFNQYEENVDTKTVYEPSEHLSEFDTTKLLKDYHKNKPTVAKLPTHPVSTKFSIEDAAAPYYHKKQQPISHQKLHQTVHEVHEVHEIPHSHKMHEHIHEHIHEEPHVVEHVHHEIPHHVPHHVSHGPQIHHEHVHHGPPSDYNLHSIKLGGHVPSKYHHSIPSHEGPTHDFKPNFKLQDVPNLYNHEPLSQKQLQKLLKEQEKTHFQPYEVPNGYHDQAPLTQKQLQKLLQSQDKAHFHAHEEPVAFHGDKPLSQKELQQLLEEQELKSKDEHEHFRHPLTGKNPASPGQYHQYLKSQEDEKIEQLVLREQLKYKQQQQHKRPHSRPVINKYHPGRKQPKRPISTPGLSAYRSPVKMPTYGYRFSV